MCQPRDLSSQLERVPKSQTSAGLRGKKAACHLRAIHCYCHHQQHLITSLCQSTVVWLHAKVESRDPGYKRAHSTLETVLVTHTQPSGSSPWPPPSLASESSTTLDSETPSSDCRDTHTAVWAFFSPLKDQLSIRKEKGFGARYPYTQILVDLLPKF
jgi:hypothetical protein